MDKNTPRYFHNPWASTYLWNFNSEKQMDLLKENNFGRLTYREIQNQNIWPNSSELFISQSKNFKPFKVRFCFVDILCISHSLQLSSN